MNERILIVDDERNIRLNYRVALEAEGFLVQDADSGAEALMRFSEDRFDLAILDLRMPGMDGLDLLAEMRRRHITTPVVIVTAYGDIPQTVRAMKLGAIDFLQKPLTPDQLRRITREVIDRHSEVVSSPMGNVDQSTEMVFGIYLKNAKRLLNLQHFDAAKENLAKAMAIDPLSAEAFNLAGAIFEMEGDHDRAKTHYEHALKLDKYYEPARQNLQQLNASAGTGAGKEPIALGGD